MYYYYLQTEYAKFIGRTTEGIKQAATITGKLVLGLLIQQLIDLWSPLYSVLYRLKLVHMNSSKTTYSGVKLVFHKARIIFEIADIRQHATIPQIKLAKDTTGN